MLKYLSIYADNEKFLNEYSDAERGQLLTAMMAYAFRGEEPTFETRDMRVLWSIFKEKIEICEQKSVRNRENGGKRSKSSGDERREATGSEPERQEATGSETAHKESDKESESDKDSEKESEKDTEAEQEKGNGKRARARFAPPALSQCEAFFLQNGGTIVQATQFHSYYQSNGWRVGKGPMKDWEAAARGWISRQRDFDAQRAQTARASPPSGDVLLRQTPQERRAAYGAAVVDLDTIGGGSG